MRLALREAESAAGRGEVPVGAVLVDAEGGVVASAGNERELLADPTAHAELLAIRRAAEKTGGWRLEGCVLYVTLEPCIMCMGAVVNSRIDTVVFGAYDPLGGALESNYGIGTDGVANHTVGYRGGVLEEQCSETLRRFFHDLRESHSGRTL
ncbi:nucleoside deaminase [Candidatus Mycalebacterium sp.]